MPQQTGTRSGILEVLKRSDGLTATDLAGSLSVSPAAARQHLAVLEAEGLVEAELRRAAVGRPSEIFRLTDKGHETFPRFYDEFMLQMLRCVREFQGPGGLKSILDARVESMYRHYGDRLAQLPVRERLTALFDLLKQSGHLPEIQEAEGETVITEFNCPIARVSREFPEICGGELILIQRLAGLPVVRDKCMAEGTESICRYRFTLPC